MLDFIDQYWSVYLPTLDSIPVEEREVLAQKQGYPGSKELIAHISDWWREAIRIVKAAMAGQQPYLDDASPADFNAHIIQNTDQRTYEQIEEDFENTREEIAALIAELSDAAFATPQIYDELYAEIVTRYHHYALPGVI
jgi:hypothetical protein